MFFYQPVPSVWFARNCPYCSIYLVTSVKDWSFPESTIINFTVMSLLINQIWFVIILSLWQFVDAVCSHRHVRKKDSYRLINVRLKGRSDKERQGDKKYVQIVSECIFCTVLSLLKSFTFFTNLLVLLITLRNWQNYLSLNDLLENSFLRRLRIAKKSIDIVFIPFWFCTPYIRTFQ